MSFIIQDKDGNPKVIEFITPVETPEGSRIGLVQHQNISRMIPQNNDDNPIIRYGESQLRRHNSLVFNNNKKN
jgi:DNA-directed RNA polymerase beta subunit